MADKQPQYPMSKEECLKIGGHCYVPTPIELLGYVHPNQKPTCHRICKHCGHRQRGYQPDYRWEDEPEEGVR